MFTEGKPTVRTVNGETTLRSLTMEWKLRDENFTARRVFKLNKLFVCVKRDELHAQWVHMSIGIHVHP